jgi:biotin synthase
MPNLTPVAYRADYEIYPAKACIRETAEDCRTCLNRRIASIGRKVGRGKGSRVNNSSLTKRF